MNEMVLMVFLFACLCAIIGIALIVMRNTQCSKPKAKKKKKLAEFSKRTIVALTVMWFVGALIGITVVAIQTIRGDYNVALSDLLLYIGAPMTGGIVTYLLKSAYENKEKIRRGGEPQEDTYDE